MLPGWTYDSKHKGNLSAIVEVNTEDAPPPTPTSQITRRWQAQEGEEESVKSHSCMRRNSSTIDGSRGKRREMQENHLDALTQLASKLAD